MLKAKGCHQRFADLLCFSFKNLSDSREASRNTFPSKGILTCILKGKKGLTRQSGASLVAQLVKNPPAMQDTWVRSLGWEDPLEKGRLPAPVFWPGESHGLYSPQGRKEAHFHFLSGKV